MNSTVKPKPITQTGKILRLLKEQGTVTNADLVKICFRYGARLKDIRDEGHIVISQNLGHGLWSYTYKGER